MNMNNVRKRIAAVLYIILSVIALLLWLFFISGASFVGGSTGPEIESTVSFGDVGGIMALGLVGAVLGIIAGIKGFGEKPAGKVLLICAAMLGIIGSISFFLIDVGEIGVLALFISIFPTLLYLLLRGKRSKD